jgi:hypothetical protein
VGKVHFDNPCRALSPAREPHAQSDIGDRFAELEKTVSAPAVEATYEDPHLAEKRVRRLSFCLDDSASWNGPG